MGWAGVGVMGWSWGKLASVLLQGLKECDAEDPGRLVGDERFPTQHVGHASGDELLA